MNNWISVSLSYKNYRIGEEINSIRLVDGSSLFIVPISAQRSENVGESGPLQAIRFSETGAEVLTKVNNTSTGWVQDLPRLNINNKGYIISIDHGIEVRDSNGVFPHAPLQSFGITGSADLNTYSQTELGFWHSGSIADIDADGLFELFAVNATDDKSIQSNPQISKGFTASFEIKSDGTLEKTSDLVISRDAWNYDIPAPSVLALLNANGDVFPDLFLGPVHDYWSAKPLRKDGMLILGSESGFRISDYKTVKMPFAENPRVLSYDEARVVDLNLDGLDDLLIQMANDDSRVYQILVSNGDGTFADKTAELFGQSLSTTQSRHHPGKNWADGLDIIDVNNDGLNDLVVRETSIYFDEIPNFVFIQKTDGTFRQATATDLNLTKDANIPQALSSSIAQFWRYFDVDNDGDADLFVQTGTWNGIGHENIKYHFQMGETKVGVNTSVGPHSYIDYFTNLSDRITVNMSGHHVYTRDGNDTILVHNLGNMLDGGQGLDRIVYNGSAQEHIVSRTQDQVIVKSVLDTKLSDQITNIERIDFSDKTIAFDINGNAGQAYRLYQAALDRTPDDRGLAGWIKYMDDSGQLNAMAQLFIDSQEFRVKYGALDNANFVNQLYLNVLDRNGDAIGFNAWVGALNTGALSRAQVLVGFSESDENKANVIGQIKDGIAYTEYW